MARGDVELLVETVLDREPVDDGDHQHRHRQQAAPLLVVAGAQTAQHGLAVPLVERVATRGRRSSSRSACGSTSKNCCCRLAVGDDAALAVDERVDALLADGQALGLVDQRQVGVVHEVVDQRGDEAGLVAEVVGDARLRLAGLLGDGLEPQRVEAALGSSTRRAAARIRCAVGGSAAMGFSRSISPVSRPLSPPRATHVPSRVDHDWPRLARRARAHRTIRLPQVFSTTDRPVKRRGGGSGLTR
jgi:hypothetical protein